MIFNEYILAKAIDMFIDLLRILIIARIFLSLIIRDPRNPLLNLVYQITEPILAPFRKLINSLGINTGMIDFSPLLAFLVLDILNNIILNIIF